jgi:hypothetical protein
MLLIQLHPAERQLSIQAELGAKPLLLKPIGAQEDALRNETPWQLADFRQRFTAIHVERKGREVGPNATRRIPQGSGAS